MELYHYGIKGQKWGVRRYQNKDGSLTDAGRKRIAKKLTKEYKKGFDSSQPFKTSDRFDNAAKNLVRNNISKDDVRQIRSALKKFRDSADEADRAEQKLFEIAEQIGDEEYKKELKRNPHFYETLHDRETLRDSYIYDFGYEEAQKRNKDLVAKTDLNEKAYKEYQETCKKIADKMLGSYGEIKLYDCEYYSYSMRDMVGSIIDSMDSQKEFDKLFE